MDVNWELDPENQPFWSVLIRGWWIVNGRYVFPTRKNLAASSASFSVDGHDELWWRHPPIVGYSWAMWKMWTFCEALWKLLTKASVSLFFMLGAPPAIQRDDAFWRNSERASIIYHDAQWFVDDLVKVKLVNFQPLLISGNICWKRCFCSKLIGFIVTIVYKNTFTLG